MSELDQKLSSFRSVSLDELDKVKLLDRVDTKFIFHSDQLPAILNDIQPFYRILEIEGIRNSSYETMYYDTSDFLTYMQHHNGKGNRFKIRFRHYMDSGLAFFEIKFRTNKGNTIKERIKKKDLFDLNSDGPRQLIAEKTGLKVEDLNLVLNIYYSRITLVDNDFKERVTIDTQLRYENYKDEKLLPCLVIAEVKQEKSGQSKMITVLRNHQVTKVRISKYCLGIIQLYDHIKKNNFKPKLLKLKKICHEYM